MAQLKIKNVGPIKNTNELDNSFLKFDGVTVFIGNQGTGKSTVSKLFSTLSWIEKALVRGDFKPSYLTQYNRFKKQLAYQNISNYLKDNSYIHYKGEAYQMIYKEGKLEIIEVIKDTFYDFPKIMYVPAERNFVSTVDRPDLIKRLPLPLYTFLEEYEYAKTNLNELVKLPIGNLTFEYRKQNKKSWLIGEDYRIELLEASSGFQSLVPLYLVTESLSKIISNPTNDSYKERSVSDESKIKKEIDRILSNKSLSDDVKNFLLERLSKSNQYASFVNVVEEPEQNLFPTSQKEILYSLLTTKNKNPKNKLILTTHSPYIINYLTLSVKGYMLNEKFGNGIADKIQEIVDKSAMLKPDTLHIYQIKDDGTITELDKYKDLPSDENYLNDILGSFNDDFVNLIDLEQQWQ